MVYALQLLYSPQKNKCILQMNTGGLAHKDEGRPAPTYRMIRSND